MGDAEGQGDRRGGEYRRTLDQMQDDLAQSRTRWHKTADTVQAHEGRLAQLEWRLQEHEKTATKLAMEMEQLVTGTQLESLREMLDLRLKVLTEALAPIQRGFYWAVGLIVGAVVLALVSLVLRSGGGG